MSEAPADGLRTYGGVSGEDRIAERRSRLLDASLTLLGGDPARAVTVRAVSTEAGLTPRYVYESFPDRDALAAATLDHVVETIAAATLAAVAAAPTGSRQRLEAGLVALVRTVADDPRLGRVLFSPALTDPAVVARRAEGARTFADLLFAQATAHLGGCSDEHAFRVAADLLVGGLGQVLAGWLDGRHPHDRSELVSTCAELFLAVAHTAEPALAEAPGA